MTTQFYYASTDATENNLMSVRADDTSTTYEQNQRWLDYGTQVEEVFQYLLAQTNNSGQDSASTINRATEVIKIKVNFNHKNCSEEIILDL